MWSIVAPQCNRLALRRITMTRLLEQVIQEVSTLPVAEQNALASIFLQEIAAEKKWAASFEKSQDFLSKLADEALEEYVAGRTKPL
jgi:recombinational DNA repair ATPase RecF